MPCYGPLVGYYSKEVNPSGSRSIVFDKRLSFSGVPIRIPCGECIGCRMDWCRQWAVRCMHEKRMHNQSAFVTLTYDDAHLPPHGSLRLRDLQLFMKRLRLVRPSGLRFFGCGEYGEGTLRPHYHLLLFNTDFPDMRQYNRVSKAGEPLYRSAELSTLWPAGQNFIGSVSFKSAAYVAGYVMKKVGRSDDFGPDREPEFRVMSRRPGIGYTWFLKYADEAYKHDSAIMQGREARLPRYYDTKYAVNHPERFEQIRVARRAKLERSELTRDRMAVKELRQLKINNTFRRPNDG